MLSLTIIKKYKLIYYYFRLEDRAYIFIKSYKLFVNLTPTVFNVMGYKKRGIFFSI